MVFSAENGKHVIELTIFSGSTVFRVVEKTSDMMVSIDAAASLHPPNELREHHNQLTESVNPDAFEKDADDLIFIPEVDKFDAPAYQVVRSKEFEFGPMSVQDAILQMNLIGHSFFAFRNEDRDGASLWSIAATTVAMASWWIALTPLLPQAFLPSETDGSHISIASGSPIGGSRFCALGVSLGQK